MADQPASQNNALEIIPTCGMPEILQNVPLHSPRKLFFVGPSTGFPSNIQVHCDSEQCGGIRRHTKIKNEDFSYGFHYHFLVYVCDNCSSGVKYFIIKQEKADGPANLMAFTKVYQEPAFGQPIPKRLFRVIGESNRDYFLQAQGAIARGLGIGAYGYYRRIVENTKFDLIGSVLEIAQATNASSEQIDLLKKAQAERQFSKAIDILRDVAAIPAALLIDGHNPLALLHDALSEGIHQLTDSECLERAQDAEVVLCEIANRMQTAVTEQKTVKSALSNIQKRKAAGAKSGA